MRNKVIAMLLAIAMLLCMAACQDNTPAGTTEPKQNDTNPVETTPNETEGPKDPVTITYYYTNGVGEQQYTTQVEEKLNEILKTMEGYEHISIDLVPTKNAQDFTLAQASGEQIDLVATYGLDFVTMVANGDFMPLEDLLAAHPEVVSEIPEWLVDTGKVHGTLYQIPAYQQCAAMYMWRIPKVFLDSTGKTAEDVRAILWNGTLEDQMDFIEELCLSSRKATGLDTKYIYNEFAYSQHHNSETIGGVTNLLLTEEGEIVFVPFTDDYKYILEREAQWWNEGLLHPEFATLKSSEFNGANFMNDVSFVNATGNTAASEAMYSESNSATAGTEVVTIMMTDHYYVPSANAAGGNAIYADCEHPEEAMMIIELLMTEKGKEFYNTLVWGLEGTHWEWVEEGKRINTLEYAGAQGGATSTYHAWKWNVGNTFNAWLNQAVTDEGNDYIINEINNGATTTTSPVMGITWDMSSVADQVAQVKAVMSEYTWRNIIVCGDQWEARYNEMIAKLVAAGIQDIIDCAQQQYADFLAK